MESKITHDYFTHVDINKKGENDFLGWKECWEDGLNPGDRWDKHSPSPALIKLVEDNCLPHGRALVPGCGRGYDVTVLASIMDHVIGLDIASVAINIAKERAISMDIHNVTFINQDFFSYCPSESFDVIYDYTFLCALPPSYRKDWASKMTELLSINGNLVTLIFPIIPGLKGGPPFEVSVDILKELLESTMILISCEKPYASHEGREGKEMLAIWKKKDLNMI